VPRTLHRPANHRVAPFTPFARRHKLVGVTREQVFDGLRVNTLARVDVFAHDLADCGLIIAAGVVLSEPRRGGNNAAKDRKLSAHNASSENAPRRRRIYSSRNYHVTNKFGAYVARFHRFRVSLIAT